MVPDPTFQAALQRGRWDIDYFAEFFLGIKGHPGQRRFWKTGLMRTESGWRAAYLTLMVSAGNRAGKTLGLAIYILHSVVYKHGLQPPSPGNQRSLMSWLRHPYDWWHFGLQGEVSELVHHELMLIFSGTHPAQRGRGCRLIDLLGPAVVNYSTKERGDYPWVVLHDALGGGQIHFRSTSERALGSLGKEMHGVSWDECAFSSDFDFVVDEVLHNRRMGTGGQMVLISTMTEGLTAFADKWNTGDPDSPDRRPSSMSLRMSTRDNLGYGLDQITFDRLLADMPEYLIPQNIDGYAIESKSAFFGAQAVDQMFDPELEAVVLPLRKHRYVQGVDPALTYDSTYAITLDRTDSAHVVGVHIDRKTGRQTTLSVSSLVMRGHHAYNQPGTTCTTVLDATGFGGKTFRDLLSDLHPFRAVEFGGTRAKKLKLLMNLKAAIEKGRLRLPRSGMWLSLRRQLLGYKLEDRKLETDAVMALALAWSEVERQPADVRDEPEFGYFTDAGPPVVSSAYGGVAPHRVSAARLGLVNEDT